MAEQKLTAQQRANNFALATRQYMQSLPSVTFVEGQTVSFQLPKARFLQKVYLQVEGSFKATHASKTTYTKTVFDKYNLLKQIRLSVNAGFNPYQISGAMLSVYNKVNRYKSNGLDGDTFGTEKLENVVSSGGTVDHVAFTLELPVTINDRDAIGLINLQDDTTVVQVQIDCNTVLAAVMTETDITVSEVALTITPVIETYSIPSIPSAVPDYSILKMVNQQVLSVVSAGEMRIPLQTALTYRKLFFYVATDTAMTAMDIAKLGKVSLVFNNADTPYSIPAKFLAYKNKVDYQGTLPAGCFCIDLSEQGIANLGGAKNYIDTERMTQFELVVSFNEIVGNTNTIYVVGEKLARLV